MEQAYAGQRLVGPTRPRAPRLPRLAPLRSPGTQLRHRLSRGGNRRLNPVLYRIALTHVRFSSQVGARLSGSPYRRGQNPPVALRALKHFLVCAIWRVWQECLAQDEAVPAAAVA